LNINLINLICTDEILTIYKIESLLTLSHLFYIL